MPMTGDEPLCQCIQCGRMHRHLGTPPWALNHDDLCRLSKSFGAATDYRTSQDQRINDWLKQLIGSAETDMLPALKGGGSEGLH
jgi:hypothetical protein